MNGDADLAVSSELQAGERLLWTGRPRQGVHLRSQDAFLVPFSFLWGGFAVFWEFSVIKSGAPIFFQLWGIPFVLVGLYITFGRFIVDAKQRNNTVYAVTDRRILVVTGLLSRAVKSVSLRTLAEVSLSEGKAGTGTITFGAPPGIGTWLAGSSWPSAGQMGPHSFQLIPNVRVVHSIILRAQREINARPE